MSHHQHRATVTAAESKNPSGAAPPVGNLPNFTQLWVQDFTTPAALGSFASVYPNWSSYDGGQDTSRNTSRPANQIGVYNSSTTTSVHNSMFDGRLFTDGNGTPNVFAITPPVQNTDGSNNAQLYGRYSVRFKIDRTPGFKIAWLLWPKDDVWAEGEVDFPEGALDDLISGYSHDVTGTPSNNAFGFDSVVPTYGEWHTATIEWIPGKLTFYLDNQSWSTTAANAQPSHLMRWALQTESQIDTIPPDPAVTGHVYVDWVTMYAYTAAAPPPPTSTIPAWDHVVVAIFENQTQGSVYNSGGYFKTFADQNANMTNSFAISHPSLPNYLALWSGSTQGVSDDGHYDFAASTPHLGSQMATAGKSFKAFSEDLPSAGYTGDSFNEYVRRHAPWVSWQANGGFSGSQHVPYTQWPTDFTTLPKLSFVIPNLIDDIHDSTVSTGATWLQSHLAPYLTWAQANNSLLIITFDEDDDNGGNNQIYTVFAGAHVATGQYSQNINHYSVLGLLQDWLGLPRLAGSVGKAQITTPWI